MKNKELLETLEDIGFRVSRSQKSFYIRKNFKTGKNIKPFKV